MPKWVTSGYKKGDLCIFDFPNTSSETDHIGIIEAVNGTTLTTIEGNTSASSSGSQSNGEGVFQKTRYVSQLNGAYRPDYTDELTADKVLAFARKEIGYIEGSGNNNKYGIAYGWNGVAYCVIFQWWIFREAGMSALFYGGGKCANCAAMKKYAQQGGTVSASNGSTTGYYAYVKKFQTWLNTNYKAGLVVDGGYGPLTKKAACKAWQNAMNALYNSGLDPDGAFGDLCRAAAKDHEVEIGCKNDLAYIVQGMLYCKGYNPQGFDGEIGAGSVAAIKKYQSGNGLDPDGSCGADTLSKMFA